MRIQVLDHGYVEYIESWGSDERIVEAARMSSGKGFIDWLPYKRCSGCDLVHILDAEDSSLCHENLAHTWVKYPRGDVGLLKYLMDNRHETPFEMAGMIIEVQAPIMVFREWHRHRTQCLAPDTLIHFDAPKSKANRRSVYKLTIAELWQRWQPTKRKDRPQRQTNALWPRTRVAAMALRSCAEDTKEVGHTRIVDVIQGEPKPMIKVMVSSGRTLTATKDHKVLTDAGWLRLGDAVEKKARLLLESTQRASARDLQPIVDTTTEKWASIPTWPTYFVSSEGRVRRGTNEPRKLTINEQGYLVCSLNRPGTQEVRTVHSLVAEAFLARPEGCVVVRHKNHNRLDARLSNLEYGTSADNTQDSKQADRLQRLTTGYERIIEVVDAGLLPTFDLAVSGPWHNFIADGFVVHNSYNEMSARYTPLPDVNYMPTVERCLIINGANKQANAVQGADQLTHESALEWLAKLAAVYEHAEEVYQDGLRRGIPKEVARLPVPVGRYSRMRASANLRNLLAFLTLRSDCVPSGRAAQHEIRQFANVVGDLIAAKFPRTYDLFVNRKAA